MHNTSNKINLVIFVEGSFIPSFDGYSLVMSNICRLLAGEKDINLTVVHCYRGWSDVKLLSKEPFKIILLSPADYYHNTKLVANILKSNKPDIIQMQDGELILSQGIKLKKHFQCHLIYHPHYIAYNLINKLSVSKTLKERVKENEKIATQFSDAVLTFTRNDQGYFKKLSSSNESKFFIVPPAIKIEVLKPNILKRKGANILFIGNLYYQANVDALDILVDEIFPRIINKNKKLFVIGNCPSKIRNYFKSKKDINILGRVDKLDYLIKLANLAIFPIIESSGIRTKILLCFAVGVPVIGYQQGFAGMKRDELIKELACLKKEELCKKASLILQHPGKQSVLARKQYIYFKKYYSSVKVLSNFIKVYRSVIKRKFCNLDYHILSKSGKMNLPAWLIEFQIKGRRSDPKIRLKLPKVLNI